MKAPVGAIILLSLAGLLWVAMMGSFSGYPDTDAAGRGLALGVGTLFGAALWLVLAALLIRAAVVGALTIWTGIGAVVCLIVSAIGASSVVDLYVLRLSWALAVLALLPLLVAAYALWPRLPLAGVIVVLSALPLVATAMKVGQPTPQDLARQEKQFQENEAARRKLAADFAKLGPDSSLGDYLPFVSGDYSFAAREAMRKVKTRQADAVALLNAGKLGELAGLLEYDVQATPDLCTAYRAAVAGAPASLDLKPQRPNMEWLNGEGCDLAEPLARFKAR
jgi:hypothetical protein